MGKSIFFSLGKFEMKSVRRTGEIVVLGINFQVSRGCFNALFLDVYWSIG